MEPAVPLKDPEARRAYERARRERIRNDPLLLAKRREQTRLAQRSRLLDPAKRDAHRACARAWAARRGRERHVAYKYGISATEYAALLESQEGACAICRRPERAVDPRTGKPRQLAVDHCHATGRIRGLLCYNCNVAIGLLHEDPWTTVAACAYLESTRAR
jgi:hypothetical protein